MAVNRRTVWLGVTLVVVAIGAVVWTSNGPRPRAGGPPPRDTPAPRAEAGESGEPEQVQLAQLKMTREEPGESLRNPFRFEARPAPSLPPPPTNQEALEPVAPAVPAGPPPPPPITVKFIGLMTQGAKRLAILSDGRTIDHGEEGSIIMGQYRILKIGTESIELAYVDGRGRQTIRLTGQ